MDTLFSCRNRKMSIKRSRTSRPGWRPFHLCADFGHAWKDLLQYQLLTIYTFRHFSGQVWACCCHSPDWLVVLECITVQFPCCRFARPGINFGTIKGVPKSHQDLIFGTCLHLMEQGVLHSCTTPLWTVSSCVTSETEQQVDLSSVSYLSWGGNDQTRAGPKLCL